MPTVDSSPNLLRPWLRVASTLVLGALTWFLVIVFEEFVTADLRWVLWLGGALLAATARWTGSRRFGAWAPLLLTVPTLALWGRIALDQTPWLWPLVPLWVGCALAGWWLGRSRPRRALLPAAALAVAIVAFGNGYIPRQLSAEANIHLDAPAPDISLQQLDGSPYPMANLAGKVVVLDFFSTWCLPCRAELTELEKVRLALAGRPDVLILVVGDGGGGDTREQIAAFSEHAGLALPFLFDPESKAHDALGFTNVPALAVIDRDHHLRLKRVGFNAAETGFKRDLLELIETL